MTSVGKTHRHLPKASMSPEWSWSRVWDVEGVTYLAVLPTGSAVGVNEDVVVLFLYCSFHTPYQDHRAALIAAQEDVRPIATVEVELDRQGDLGVEVESMNGDLARKTCSRHNTFVASF